MGLRSIWDSLVQGSIHAVIVAVAIITSGIMVGIAIPALVTMMQSLDLPMEIVIPQAHLFVIFFSAFSSITPPTAPTSYAAAAIAQSPVMATSVEAMKLALPAFLLPYMFVANPSLLLIGTVGKVSIAIVLAIAGVICMAMAIQNYAYTPLDPVRRRLFFAAGIGLIGPNLHWYIPGAIVGVGLYVYQWWRYGRRGLAEASPGV